MGRAFAGNWRTTRMSAPSGVTPAARTPGVSPRIFFSIKTLAKCAGKAYVAKKTMAFPDMERFFRS